MEKTPDRWRERVSGNDYDIDKHFTPKYQPWDQRLCQCQTETCLRLLGAARLKLLQIPLINSQKKESW